MVKLDLDLDPDPDPHKMNADPQPCINLSLIHLDVRDLAAVTAAVDQIEAQLSLPYPYSSWLCEMPQL